MKQYFMDMARYNRWANARLYASAAGLSDEAYRRDIGVYFQSLHLTLKHLLDTDRAWMHLLGGGTLADLPMLPPPLDFAGLRVAREELDARLADFLGGIDQDWLERPFAFTSSLGSWKGLTYHGTHASTLGHLFNHQAHHRGQAHTALLLLGIEPPALDILVRGMLGE